MKLRSVNGNIQERAEHYTCFTRLPSATQAVTTDLDWDQLGTATLEAPTRPANGGAALQTQTGTEADGDTTYLLNLFPGDLDVNYQPTFEATVSVEPTTAALKPAMWYFGFRDTADVDPAGESDDAAGFFCQGAAGNAGTDTDGNTVGLVNWYVHEAHGGTDTYVNTDIPYELGVDVKLAVRVGDDLKARYYIDDVLVYTGTAFTSGEVFQGFAGTELVTAAGNSAKFEVRYVKITQAFTAST
ncbi:MAG: hypothetical protein AB7V18_19440 [Pyrinomonadaceae bacterium]